MQAATRGIGRAASRAHQPAGSAVLCSSCVTARPTPVLQGPGIRSGQITQPCSGPALARRRHQQRSLVVVATSEHWWEDEEEFDAVQGMVLPKDLYVLVSDGSAAPSACLAQLRGLKFASGFAAPQARESAGAVWSELGQDGAPFFKKIRTRDTLGVLEDADASDARAAAAADAFWQELCTQTWRVELDYGLGTDLVPTDRLLVVCKRLAAERLLSCAGIGIASDLTRVAVSGFNTDGLAREPLKSWRQLPQPKPHHQQLAPAS